MGAEKLFKHGCICSKLKENPAPANIKPYDELDGICQEFAHCQNCIRQDYRRRSRECERTMFDITFNFATKEYTCATMDTCDNDYCRCSKQFSEAVAEHISHNNYFAHQKIRDRFCE